MNEMSQRARSAAVIARPPAPNDQPAPLRRHARRAEGQASVTGGVGVGRRRAVGVVRRHLQRREDPLLQEREQRLAARLLDDAPRDRVARVAVLVVGARLVVERLVAQRSMMPSVVIGCSQSGIA